MTRYRVTRVQTAVGVLSAKRNLSAKEGVNQSASAGPRKSNNIILCRAIILLLPVLMALQLKLRYLERNEHDINKGLNLKL